MTNIDYKLLYEQAQDTIKSLKEEIRIQRKEIAGLREERRKLFDNDKPPMTGCDIV